MVRSLATRRGCGGLSVPLAALALLGAGLLLPEAAARGVIRYKVPGGGGPYIQPLNRAADEGDLAKVQQELAKDPTCLDKDSWDYTALYHAASGGHRAVAEFLIAKGADVNKSAPIVGAAAGGHIQVAELLIEKKADINALSPHRYVSWLAVSPGNSALTAAVQHKKKEMAAWLVAKGADVNKKGIFAPLHWAYDAEIAKLLTGKGADPNAQAVAILATPLHVAALRELPDVVEILLASGAKPDGQDYEGKRALHRAFGWGCMVADVRAPEGFSHQVKMDYSMDYQGTVTPGWDVRERAVEDCVTRLLKKGANPNAQDKQGTTPLHTVVKLTFGREALARVLLDGGADPKVQDKDGRTPLHEAIDSAMRDAVIGLLVAKGAPVNARDKDGKTPLHVAVEGGWREATEKLLAAGADVNVKDNAGRTSLDLDEHKVLAKAIKEQQGAKKQ